MTDEAIQTADLPAEQLRDAVNSLSQAVTTLLEGEASLTTFEAALSNYDAIHDQLALYSPDDSTMGSLQRIEHFITLQAGLYYQTVYSDLDEQQSNRFIVTHARQLLTLDGIGPATARQLFQLGVFTPDQFFALTPKEVAQLSLSSATLARLIPLHAQSSHADTA
jgi:hypothetical protein